MDQEMFQLDFQIENSIKMLIISCGGGDEWVRSWVGE